MSTKAFELVSALERQVLLSDIRGSTSSGSSATATEIVSLDCCTKNIFIGTSNGLIIHYVIDERRSGERVTFKSHLQGKKFVAKKPIQLLKYIAAIDKAIILVDGIIYVFDTSKFDISGSHDRLRNAHTFCVNEHKDGSNPFSQQICVASKKKHVQLYNLTAERWIHIRDIGLPELPLQISMDAFMVCVTLQTRYMLVNTETSKLLDLFPYDRESDSPFIKRVESGEFFLGGPSDLGMFVTSSGMSQRPPIQLKTGTFSLGFSSPYMIALNQEFIVVHNIIDQQLKQAIQFQRGLGLQEFSDRILVASSQDIYALVPVPWQKQVDSLLTDKKVDEALTLAEASFRTSGLSRSQFNSIHAIILQKSGFIELSLDNFTTAQKYFTSGGVDPREVISLFPDLLSTSSEFSRVRPPLHDFADMRQITRGELHKMEECKAWLTTFLESSHFKMSVKKDVHTTLMKIYSENRPADLLKLLMKGYHGHPSDTVNTLQTFGRFHALAVFYQHNRELDKALSLWSRLLNKDLEDESFDSLGLPYFADVLSKMADAELVLNYAPVVLCNDQVIGSQIFTKRFDVDGETVDKRMRPEAVIEFLVRFPEALTLYLEHLVITAKQQKESFHSHLAMVYLDSLVQAKQIESDGLQSKRETLQAFLKQSDKYSVSLILGRVERDNWLLPEAAILYGKVGNDKAALDILVDKLGDLRGAEEYCITHSALKATGAEQQALFELLLHLYLDKTRQDERMRLPVIDLLNNPKAVFNAAKVAQLIPDDWSIALLSKFMLNSVRASLHNGRQVRISSQLAYRDYFLAKKDHLTLRSTTVNLTDSRRCDACHQPFRESSFVRTAEGAVVHPNCAKT